MRARILALVLSVTFAAPAAGLAQRGGAGAHPGGTAPARTPVAATPARPAAGGFNLNRDVNASTRANNTYHPPVNVQPNHPPVNIQPNHPPVNVQPNHFPVNIQPNHPPVNVQPNHFPVNVQPNRQPVTNNRPPSHVRVDNPRYRGRPAWGWNRGVVWAPAPAYWGGGFWGPFAFGAAFGAVLYGTFADQATNQVFTSYQVAQGSPGATLLSNYQLTQTPCGPPDLVVIFGPDNSVICAYPNDLVGPGEYEIDPSTFTLVSQ